MKKYFFLFVIVIIFLFKIQPVNGQSENFELKLRIYKEEISKDSHSDTYNIHITRRDVKYSWIHTGYPDLKEDTKNYKLSKATFEKLVIFIIKNRLNRNLKEKSVFGKLGLSVSLFLKITMNAKTTVMYISGMYNDWQERGGSKSNIKNIKYYHFADSIVTSIKNRLDYF